LQPQGVGAEEGERGEALRLRGPARETFTVEAELDATDQLEDPAGTGNAAVAEHGLLPALATLELLVNPSVAALRAQDLAARAGAFEIAPVESPLTVFVWSRERVVPVRVTELTVAEEAFDSNLNPIRARVTLALRVLTVDDLGFAHRGAGLFLLHQQRREQLAGLHRSAALRGLGLSAVPGVR
jgi:hypothetical protein